MENNDQINETTDSDPFDELVIASVGKRFANMILDYFFYFIFACIFGFILGIISGFLVFFHISVTFVNDINYTLLAWIIFIFYYLILEALTSQTIGKLITGTKVVNADGTRLTFKKALGRTLCRFIPFEQF